MDSKFYFLQEPEITDSKVGHNHLPGDELFRKNHKVKLKVESQNSGLPTRSIINQNCRAMNEEELAALPSETAMKRQVQRVRKDLQSDPKNPTDRSDFEIDEKYRKYCNEQFLRVDTGAEDPDRILIFITDEGIKDLKTYKNWSMDGTFKSSPHIYKQIITIHVHINETQTAPR